MDRWKMQASSLASRLKWILRPRDWGWWSLPPVLRAYVGVLPVAAVVVIGIAAAYTEWRVPDLAKFLLLMCCAVISVGSTPREVYSAGVSRDFSTIWVLPTAILLPPVYAALMPIPI